MNQKSFADAMDRLKKLAKSYENMLAVADIKEEVQELNLTEQQLQAVYDYLIENKIQIADYNKEKVGSQQENQEDTKFLKRYREEFSHCQDISTERLNEIFWQAVRKEGSAREEVVSGYVNRIADIARMYRGQGVLLEDLVQEGNLGLLHGLFAAEEQPEIENPQDYLMEQICESIESAIYEEEAANAAEDYLVKQIEEIDKNIHSFEQENHRKPFAEELAELMDRETEEVKDLMKYLK